MATPIPTIRARAKEGTDPDLRIGVFFWIKMVIDPTYLKKQQMWCKYTLSLSFLLYQWELYLTH